MSLLDTFTNLFHQKAQAGDFTPGFANYLDQSATAPNQPVNEQDQLAERFRKGFAQYGSPLAAHSQDFARAALNHPLPDPMLPAVLALKETSGGKNLKFRNNPFNWGMQDMESTPYAINQIYSGIGQRFPQYQQYLQSGNLTDFFKHYSPANENPAYPEQVSTYNKLRNNYYGT